MKKPTLVTGVIALVISLGLIYGYTYVIGKSWKASQK